MPLHLAVLQENISMIKKLVHLGCPVDVMDDREVRICECGVVSLNLPAHHIISQDEDRYAKPIRKLDC